MHGIITIHHVWLASGEGGGGGGGGLATVVPISRLPYSWNHSSVIRLPLLTMLTLERARSRLE